MYLVFFASGFSALLYQVVWQRLLLMFSGTDVQSATIVVAAFMAGLGCGSVAGGKIADRLPRLTSLWLFAVAELAVGSFGFFSTNFYYDLLYRRLGHHAATPEAMAAILFVSLLWPTFFMGMSLPLLARALVSEINTAARITGALYGYNTLGAAAGALLTTWWLLPRYGLEGSLRISATLNVLAAAGALSLALGLRKSDSKSEPAPAPEGSSTSLAPGSPTQTLGFSFPTWACIYGLAGFLALSLEIVWFRLMIVMLKSTAYTFGTLLFVYLAGLGLGAAASSLLVTRTRQPVRAFLLMQTTIGAYAGGGLAVLLANLDRPSLASLSTYFGGYDPIDVRAAIVALAASMKGAADVPWAFLLLYFGLPILLIGPPTVLMGASFPLIQKAVQTDPRRVGTRVGTVVMANIAGSILGCVLTGWFCLEWLGTAGTLKLLVAVSGVFLLFVLKLSVSTRGARPTARREWGYIAAMAAVAGLVLAMPSGRLLWAHLHGTRPISIVFGEDGSGTSVLKTESGGRESRVVVFVNGVAQSWIPYGGIHTVLGALPAFIHPNPRVAAVIGLGSGDTVFGMAGRKELQRLICIEIISPQIDTLRHLDRVRSYTGLQTVLFDPRLEHVHGDGRVHVMHAGRTFDLIEADALRPTSAYAGNLYSDAYFTLLRERLNPGGIAVSWSPTTRTHDTFVKVFPHVLSFGHVVLGSNERIDFDPRTIRVRLADPFVLEHYTLSGIDIAALLAPYLDRAPGVYDPSSDRSQLQDINTDLFPRDEFGVAPAIQRVLRARP